MRYILNSVVENRNKNTGMLDAAVLVPLKGLFDKGL